MVFVQIEPPATGSEAVQIVTAIAALIGTCFTVYMTYLMARLTTGQKAAAEIQQKAAETAADHAADVKDALDANTKITADKADEVRVALVKSNDRVDEKLNQTLEVAHVIHTLVNNEMHLALSANAKLARKLANVEKTGENEAAADLAEKLLEEHDAKQRTVDEAKGA